MTYDEACRRLHNNYCSKINNYRTKCKGCPCSDTCYGEYSGDTTEERNNKFENAIIARVTELNIQ